MTKEEFIQRFKLYSMPESVHTYRHSSSLKASAVLIPLIEIHCELHIVLTVRAKHLKHHGGQISFPGGKYEESDHSLIHTALRETHEEIGVNKSSIEVVGQLNDYQTVTGYNVIPVVGFINSPFSYSIDENEVSEIFQVPLHHFLHNDSHFSIPIVRNGVTFNVSFIPYKGYNIWGATAGMLKDLVNHIR